jgi:hypothetical protein
MKHFKDQYNPIEAEDTCSQIKVLKHMPKFFNDTESDEIDKAVMIEEVKEIVCSMPKDKSPDPDGWTQELFQLSSRLWGRIFTRPLKNPEFLALYQEHSMLPSSLLFQETTSHMFIHCDTTQFIWKEILNSLNITDAWKYSTLEENLLQLFTQYPRMRHIPFLVIWGIWKYRKKILFENWQRVDSRISTKNMLDIKELKGVGEVDKCDYILNLVFFDENPIGFFDGVVVDDNCGVGIFIKLNSDHIYRAHFAGGK